MTVNAKLKLIDNNRFVARSGNSPAYVIDSADGEGGVNPMQMLLMSVAGCTAIDVIGILTKKRIKLSGFEVNIVGDEAEEHPQRYTKLNIEYVFYGSNIRSKALEQAIELSETRYCCALASLNAELESSYRVEAEMP
ncbi:MAG: putative redox protein [Gammaproteobacteria bacterium]|jgi:putative redox protein